MPKKKAHVNGPDSGDVAQVVADALEDFDLVFKFEWLFQGAGNTCVCRAYRNGAVRRADVVWQAKHTAPDTAARNASYVAYHAALDCYMQADRARVREGFEAQVGLAPVVSVPL